MNNCLIRFKAGQCQPRIIIWTNLVGHTFLILHTKSQGHWPSGSKEELFSKFDLLYMNMATILVMES